MRDDYEIQEEDRFEGERFHNKGSSSKGSNNSSSADYSDPRFSEVEADKKEALTESENLYSGMIDNTDKFYDDQIQASKDWADKQSQLQQEQTDFVVEQIEQQKEQTQKDYIKEQSGAYSDWQKQSNKYGAEAEMLASQGLTNTGYSESSQVRMYNTYQSRITAAREAVNRAMLNYDNSIKEAILQNNSALAQIAFQALQQQLELALQGFQHKNQLLLEQSNKQLEIDQMYHNRWQDVLQQINAEKALAEQIRQFNESMALEREQFEWQKEQASFKSSSGGGGSSSGSGGNGVKITDNSGSEESGMSKETANSILASGLGPVSQQGLADAVASGKVYTTTNSNGNTVVRNPAASNHDNSAYWSSQSSASSSKNTSLASTYKKYE